MSDIDVDRIETKITPLVQAACYPIIEGQE